jgi:hypothetical protein
MTNQKKYLRKAYYDALNNTITLGGVPVPCFDSFSRDTVNPPFILITSMQMIDDKNKSRFAYRMQTTIDIVTMGVGGYGRLDADTIAEGVLDLVVKFNNTYLTMDNGATIFSSSLAGQNSFSSISGTNIVHREVLTIENLIDGTDSGLPVSSINTLQPTLQFTI